MGPDELRLSPLGTDAARRRDDVGARRGASANRLMGAVVRGLLDEEDEERVEADGASVGEGGSASLAAAGSERSERGEVRRVGVAGRPRRAGSGGTRAVVRSGRGIQQGAGEESQARGDVVAGREAAAARTGAEAGVWASPAPDVEAAARVVTPQSRITPVGQRDRLTTDRPSAPERVGRSSGMARLSWGAVLAAVVGLVAVLLTGGFESPGTEGAQMMGGSQGAKDGQAGTQNGSPQGSR